jgi:hypothetical protein
MKLTLFHVIVFVNGLFYECIHVSLFLQQVTFHRWYNYKNQGCHLMCFSFHLWILWPFGIWWISLVLHLPRSFHIQTPTYLTLCYRLGGVSCMNCFMGSHGFLATSCTLNFQDHMLFHFQSPKDSVIASKNVLYNFGWSIALVVDCF